MICDNELTTCRHVRLCQPTRASARSNSKNPLTRRCLDCSFRGYDFSGMVVVAATRKLNQLAELSARTCRHLFLWLVHRCVHVELLYTEGMGMSSLTSINRLVLARTTVITPSSDHSAPCPIHSPMPEISENALCDFCARCANAPTT